MGWREQIVIDPAVAKGQPTLRVSQVLALPLVETLINGAKIEEIKQQNPQITEPEIEAIIEYTRLQIVDREIPWQHQFALIVELLGLVCFSFGYGLSLSTLWSYEILGFIAIAYVITWMSLKYQLLDYIGKVSSFRVKPLIMIAFATIGFALKFFFPDPSFVPLLLLGTLLLSLSELSNQNKYLRWISWGRTINVVLMSSPILLLIAFILLRLISGGNLGFYDSLLLLAYGIVGSVITVLSYRRFVNTDLEKSLGKSSPTL
ncbi:MAG: DUF433 domain-containing protein [Acidobacteria bacterium]|nr:DUF433 domain-containing protein [Acidobacteriota bacterium]